MRALTLPAAADTFGFANLGQFARAVAAAYSPTPVLDPRLQGALPNGVHRTGGDVGEGHLVPPAFSREIWQATFGDGADVDLLQLIAPDFTVSNSVEFAADDSTPWSAFGVKAYWRHEAEQMTPSKLTQEPRSLRLGELYAFVLATQELLTDAPRLRNHLLKKAPAAIRWKASVALMRGSGNGQPLGWLGAPGTVTVAPEGAQAPRTVTAVNVAKMFARMLPGAIQEAVWLVNSDVLPQLVTMTLGGQPIWLPASGLAGAPNGYLFGRPVIFSEHCSSIGDHGDIQFVAPRSGYYCPVKMNEGDNLLQFDTSMHLYFDYALEAFRWTLRIAGQPYLGAPVSPAHGGNAKSHFVTLGARVEE